MKYSSSFTHDLVIGEKAETWAKELFYGDLKVEVKVDSMAHRTGNIYIEVYSRGKPSGISTTDADIWIYKIEEVGVSIVIPIRNLKELVRESFTHHGFKSGGDEDTSVGVLIPISKIFRK